MIMGVLTAVGCTLLTRILCGARFLGQRPHELHHSVLALT